MKRKTFLYFTLTLLTVPLFAFGLFVLASQANQAYAHDVRGSGTHMVGMGNNMHGGNRGQMIEMMKQHHGENWQEGCNKMMQEMSQKS